MSDSLVTVQCSTCQAEVEIPQSWLGKRRPCPACHGWIQMPERPLRGDSAATATLVPPPAQPTPATDPYGNTLVSRPGIPADSTQVAPGSVTPTGPLKFSDRLKQAAARAGGGTAGPGSRPPGANRANTPGGTPTGWSPPGTAPAKPTGSIDYGRDRAGESAAQRQHGQHGPRAPGDEWDDKGNEWSNRGDRTQRSDLEKSPRRAGARREPRGKEPNSIMGIVGMVCAILALVLVGVGCLGIGLAMNSATTGASPPPDGWLMVIGCSFLVTPVINLAGVVFSAIGFYTSESKKVIPIIGLAINGLMLLAVIALFCLGAMQQ